MEMDIITHIGDGDNEASVMARLRGYSLGTPPKVNADPDFCEEGEWPWAEFDLLTDDGQAADWPYKLASEKDLQRIEAMFVERLWKECH